ncbi:MAG: alpha/beta hydrolase [Solirubrobacterales bacterium]|nr:alpha/beta hydrolase [Solirubrobacterales bacterium]
MRVGRVRGTAALAAACGALAGMAQPAVAAELERCGGDRPRSCLRMTVPLDRSGAVPGTVRLRVDRHRATRKATRPPLFLLAGGPGQSAITAWSTSAVDATLGRATRRTRDVIVIDQRGTGRSGLLDCPAVQRGSFDAIGACAAKLGPARDFFTSADMADDIDAVRAALGAERIALVGVSYGTHLALTYAGRHPTRVERLLLDSPVPPAGVDLFARPSMRAAPRVVASTCGRRRCRSFTRDAAADLRALAARLEDGPMRGLVTRPDGRRRPAAIDGAGLLEMIAGGDVSGLFADYIPGAVRRARQGDPALLLRTARLLRRSAGETDDARTMSLASYLATLCGESGLPWTAATAPGERLAAASLLAEGLGADAFAPFGPKTALGYAPLRACARWPYPSRPAAAPAPPPDVPALVLVGARDSRTPVADARAVAALLPRAELRVVRNAGHSVLGAGAFECPMRAAGRFLAGRPAGGCAAIAPVTLGVWKPPPSRVGDLPTFGLRPRVGRTLAAVDATATDFVSVFLPEMMAALEQAFAGEEPSRFSPRFGALRGGSYVAATSGVRFERASVVQGVRVSGALRGATPKRMRLRVRIGGRAGLRGRLTFSRRGVSGEVDGRRVRIRRTIPSLALMAESERAATPPDPLAVLREALDADPRPPAPSLAPPPNPFR